MVLHQRKAQPARVCVGIWWPPDVQLADGESGGPALRPLARPPLPFAPEKPSLRTAATELRFSRGEHVVGKWNTKKGSGMCKQIFPNQHTTAESVLPSLLTLPFLPSAAADAQPRADSNTLQWSPRQPCLEVTSVLPDFQEASAAWGLA